MSVRVLFLWYQYCVRRAFVHSIFSPKSLILHIGTVEVEYIYVQLGKKKINLLKKQKCLL